LVWAERYDFGGYEYFQDVMVGEDGNPIAGGFTDYSSATPYDLLLTKFVPSIGITQLEKFRGYGKRIVGFKTGNFV